jgi:hypothetical protein
MRALQFAIATANLACQNALLFLLASLVTVELVERPTLQHLPVCIASSFWTAYSSVSSSLWNCSPIHHSL